MKKLLIVSLMLLSLLSLAACGTTQQENTTDSTDTADSSQSTTDASANTSADSQTSDGKIRPQSDQVAAQLENNLTDGKLAASFDANSLKEEDGKLQLTFIVYNYEEFSGVEITDLKEGDVIVVNGQDLTVNSVTEENGYITVNGGEEDGGVTFAPNGDAGTYYVMGMDDSKTYYEVGQLTLPVADTCVLTDDSDPDNHGKTTPASDLTALLAQQDADPYGFTSQNTTITVENSQITAIYRSFLP